MDLGPYSDTKAKNLSGGNKRKLVCAMSLIGFPIIEFLDEPTTGVDPVSSRSLFRLLKGLKDSSMVLTTHRMDEAESLCDNVAIQVNGRFVCFGTPGQLKHTYGKGYTVGLKHMKSTTQALEFVLESKIPYLKKAEAQKTVGEEESDLPIEVTYVVKDDINGAIVGGLSALLTALNDLKKDLLVKDFSVTRASLESVFIDFAKHQ
jgi:ATP-binding cassette, subfamily A (ABC1), member 3